MIQERKSITLHVSTFSQLFPFSAIALQRSCIKHVEILISVYSSPVLSHVMMEFKAVQKRGPLFSFFFTCVLHFLSNLYVVQT